MTEDIKWLEVPVVALPKRKKKQVDERLTFNQYVRAHMAAYGLKAEDMAGALFISASLFNNYVNGRGMWALYDVVHIMQKFGRPFSDLDDLKW